MSNSNFFDHGNVYEIIANDDELKAVNDMYLLNHPTAYNILIKATSLKEMFDLMMLEQNREKVYSLTAVEINILIEYVKTLYSNIENPTFDDTDYYELLIETFMYLPNGPEELENDPEILIQGSPLRITGGALASGTYYLEGDTQLTSFLSIPFGNHVTIDLNGYALIGAGIDDGIGESKNFVIVTSGEDSLLTIIDSRPNESHGIDINANGVAIYPAANPNNPTAIIKGGFIYNKGLGKGILVSTSTLKLEAGNIIGCQGLIGAAITVSSTGILEINGGTICYNSATSTAHGGGAIYGEQANSNNGSAMTLKNATITHNYADVHGGAIFGYKVEIENSNISNNMANYNGGAIFMRNASAVLSIKNSIINNNQANVHGGAIYAFNLNASKSSMCDNTCGDVGGAIHMPEGTINLQLIDCDFERNKAQTAGGVFYRTANALLISGCNFIQNEANINGGGLYTYYSSANIQNCNFISNKVNAGWGGGLLVYGSDPTNISNCLFERNNAELGGGMYFGHYYLGTDPNNPNVQVGSTLTNNCIFKNNIAVKCGGGIYIGENLAKTTNRNVTIENVEIINNEAGIDGGGIYIAESGEALINSDKRNGAIITNAILSENKAENNGGGAYVTAGDFTLISGELSNNTCNNFGGGVYTNNGNIYIGVEGCKYTQKEENHTVEPYTHLPHPIVRNNSSARGGGLYTSGIDTYVVQHCGAIFDNITSDGGPNIYVENGTLEYNNGSIGTKYNTGLFVSDGQLNDNSEEVTGSNKELHYHSSLYPIGETSEIIFNVHIPTSRLITYPKCDSLFLEDSDNTTPTWTDLFPKHSLVSWIGDEDLDEEAVHLYAIWNDNSGN